MTNKLKVLIAVGGTGGHVFPGCNLANHLNERSLDVQLVTDKRGKKYTEQFKNFKITVLPSSPFVSKNIFMIFLSSIIIFYSIIRSLLFLVFNRPNIIFGMGGYASFPICIAASILRIKFIIYENNLVIGKANKFLLPLAFKILISNKELEGVSKKYFKKLIEIGNIIKKEIIFFSKEGLDKTDKSNLNILIMGGSQAARIFAEILPNIFLECKKKKINLKIYQHCLPNQIDQLESFYKKNKVNHEIFIFSKNLINYFSKVNLAITRSGSSTLAELTNANIPFISVPLPTSTENHQLKNAIFYKKNNLAFLIEEKDLSNKLFDLLKDIYDNKAKLKDIEDNQKRFSDKNVYNKINEALKDIINEKS